MPHSLKAVRRGGWLGLLGLPALVLATPAVAEPLTERKAIERALGDADAAARDRAQRAAAQAAARAVPLLENPDVTVSRSELDGPATKETEREIGVTQALDVPGRRASLPTWIALATNASRRFGAPMPPAPPQSRNTASAQPLASGCERRTLAAERTAAADTAAYDLRRIRIAARTATAEATLASGEVEADCAALSRLTGVAEARTATPLPELLSLRPGGSPAARPDLLAQARRVSAAEANARAAERARIPELRLAWAIGAGGDGTAGQRASGPVISLGATIPLWCWARPPSCSLWPCCPRPAPTGRSPPRLCCSWERPPTPSTWRTCPPSWSGRARGRR